MAHVFLLAQHQFCNISGSYLEGHNKHHRASATPAACLAIKEQPLLSASLYAQGCCPSIPTQQKKHEWSPRVINNGRALQWTSQQYYVSQHLCSDNSSQKKSLPLECKMCTGIWQWFRIWGEEWDCSFGSGPGADLESAVASWLLSHYLFQSVEPWAFAKNFDCSWAANKSKTKHLCNRYVQLYKLTMAKLSVVRTTCQLSYSGWTGKKSALEKAPGRITSTPQSFVFIYPQLSEVLGGFSIASCPLLHEGEENYSFDL